MNLSTTFASLRKQVAGVSLVALVAGLFATGVATAATSHTFSDVPTDAWFATYVNGLADAGVVDSTKDMYRPGDLVNRAEMAKFAFMVSGLPMETATAAPYKDVAMGQWYTNYVYTLTKNGVVSGDKKDGVPTGYFRPTDALNRAEATKMLVNAAQMAEDVSGAPHFPDVKSADWFYNFVETAFNNGVVAGYPDGNFRPANNINRAEAAKMVYLSMNPVSAGFTLDSAAAASTSKVELIFSHNVDKATAEMAANYSIEDSAGVKLAVSSALMVAPDTVDLTTATQTAGVTYFVTPKSIKSEAGDSLANTDAVSFLGYGADVSGGDLKVALSTETPVAGSIPRGATGVVFTCWDFQAPGSSAVVVKSVHVHRVGPGSQTDFTNVYLYNGDQRLTTGRSINSETQIVEFNNVNVNVAAGKTAKLCLVADMGTNPGGVHAFEIASAADVLSNSSNMTGSFPLRGADQLITSASVGSTTIQKNGSLDELTVGQKDARISQFQLTANGSEDQLLKRVALYIGGAINPSEITNLRLYSTDDSTTVLASTSAVGMKTLATFTLTKAFKIGRGQNKVFYVVADVGGRDGDDIKTYLDTPTDLNVIGVTYGYGTQVKNSTADGGSFDGATTNYSIVTLKGGVFNIAFKGPSSGNLASGQKQAHCLDFDIINGGDNDVELRDWPLALDILNAPLATGGLTDGTTANYSLVKMATLNADGSVAGSLLGPSELTTAIGGQTHQKVTLSGTATIAAKSTVHAAIVLDVRSANAAMENDQLRCTIAAAADGYTQGLVSVPNAVKNTTQNKALDAKSITPASPIIGNVFTIKPGALTVSLSATPSTQTYTRGSTNVALAGFSFTAGSSLNETIKSLTLSGSIDGDNNGVWSIAGSGSDAGVALSNVIDSGVALYNGATMVSDLKNINNTDGTVVFNNLNISIPKSSTVNLVLKGNVSNSAPFLFAQNNVQFGIADGSKVIAIDQNGQNVDSASIVTTAATNATHSVFMKVTAFGTGTVGSSSTNSPSVTSGMVDLVAGKWTFTSVNDNPSLKDLDFMVLNGSPASVTAVKLYKDSACTVQVGSTYNPLPSGLVQVRDLNETITTLATYNLCAKVTVNTVGSGGADPVSGSKVGLALMSVSKVTSGSGLNVAQNYAGSKIGLGGSTLTAAVDALATTVVMPVTDVSGLVPGSVIQIDGEMMKVTGVAALNVTVQRGTAGNPSFAGTVRTSHQLGATVTLSTVAVVLPAPPLNGDIFTDGVDYCLTTDATGPTYVGIMGSAAVCPIVPGPGESKFPLHGPLSTLYKSVPQVSFNALPSGSLSPVTTVADFTITPVGNNVTFVKGTSHLIVHYTANNSTLGSCTLKEKGGSDLDTQAAGGSTIDFNFNGAPSVASDYSMTTATELQVECAVTYGIAPSTPSSIATQFVGSDDPIQWNDGNVDVTLAGAALFPSASASQTTSA